MNEKPKRKLPTDAQYLIFIKELETNADFFEHHTVCGSNSIWEPIVKTMNNEEGPTNNVEQWRNILKRWKFSTRQKFRSIDYNKPGALDIFTPMQQRLLLALGNLDVNSCRGCFQKNPFNITSKWYPLFEDMENLNSLSDKAEIFSKITHFQISKSDMLPRWLCTECWKKCEDWYEFLKKCKGCGGVYDNNEVLDNNYEDLHIPVNEKPIKKICTKKKSNENIDTRNKTNKNNTDGDILIKEETVNCLSTHIAILNTSSADNLNKDNLDTTFDPLETIYIKEESSPLTIEIDADLIKIELPTIDVVKSYDNSFESKSIIINELDEVHNKEIKVEEELMVNSTDFGMNQNNDSDNHSEGTDENNENKFEPIIEIKKINKKHRIIKFRKNPNKEFECFDCKMAFIKLTMLKFHIQSHGPRDINRKHICEICGSGFTAAYRLRRHLKRHDPSSRCKCLDCGKMFSTASDLASHEKRYLGKTGHPYPHEKPYKCDLCPKTFQQLSDLNFHEEIHKEIIPPPVHFCEICNKIYKSRKSLRDHGYTCHKNLEKKYLCSECGKSFLKPNLLLTHQRTHDPTAELFPCTKCNKKFNTPLLLRAHSRTHTEQRPFVCTICNKSFKINSHLQTHNRVHTGVRPFSCDICNMTFAYLDVLKRHKKKHADMEY